jgi:hypothetical protein
LNRFFASQNIGPPWGDQDQVIKTHGFHSAGSGTYIAGVAGLDQDKTGMHLRTEVRRVK